MRLLSRLRRKPTRTNHENQAETSRSNETTISGERSSTTSNTKPQPTLKYHPLASPTAFRLLDLQRASTPDALLEGRLSHHIRGTINYETLSYEWGQPNPSDPYILINGHRTQIRSNLHAALSAIRLADQDRRIWIDALCINQTDTAERSHQVRVMGAIYTGADRVLVWLGPGTDNSAYAMDVLSDPRALQERDAVLLSTEHLTICALCERSYWTRVWVQQEIYLATKFEILCGSKHIPDSVFDWSLSILTEPARDGVCPEPRVERSPANRVMRNKRRVPQTVNGLYLWLDMGITLGLQTSEPRDIIYAMLGISSDCGPEDMVPDYEKPLLDVYLETIWLCEAKHRFRNPERLRRLLAERLGFEYDDELQRLLSEGLGRVSTYGFRDIEAFEPPEDR
ncbi:HET-domain-containing protein [Decorospora gaudefroyi]|uniref:HET-domain-containing protein n=1 Tax=Decorospora gaudefroyi TaxID=184978 RepID=A0A6A5KH91_9PLEO|nr:HET-domain-containing protein [Decorospora gaudefroyi]